MKTKRLFEVTIDGVEVRATVFGKQDDRPAGECVVYVEQSRGNMRFYLSHSEMLSLGHKMIDAALEAEKVEAAGGLF